MIFKIINILKKINSIFVDAVDAVGNAPAIMSNLSVELIATIALHLISPRTVTINDLTMPTIRILHLMHTDGIKDVVVAAFICGYLAGNPQTAIEYAKMYKIAEEEEFQELTQDKTDTIMSGMNPTDFLNMIKGLKK